MNSAQADAYLRRIGAQHPAWPTSDVLRELQLRHLRTVPFENLSIHLGEEIVLEEKRLLDKVVGARRGGFCYELNGAFGALLAALGFDVTLLAARVYGDEGPARGSLRPSRAAGADGGRRAIGWPTSGSGRTATTRWRSGNGANRGTPEGCSGSSSRRRTRPGGGSGRFPGARGPRRVPGDKRQYRLEVRPRVLGDFVAGAWWHGTSPLSHFTRSLVCSRVTEDGGRITLSGRRFT